MLSGPPRRRPARPVGDAPVDQLVGRSEAIAKGWLLALLEPAPLEDAPAIATAELARKGPRLCEAALRALADDGALARISPGGALAPLVAEVGTLVGARDTVACLQAVDALQAVIWSGLRETLTRPAPDQIADLAERLALVSERLRVAAVTRTVAGERTEPARPAAPEARDPLEEVTAALTHCGRTGGRLSLILVEVEDVERLLAVDGPEGSAAALAWFHRALRSVLGERDEIVSESDARAWIVARESGRVEAQALGRQIAEAVREAGRWRGAPLAIGVGVAALDDDGRDAGALVEAAERDRFTASAQGLSVSRLEDFRRED